MQLYHLQVISNQHSQSPNASAVDLSSGSDNMLRWVSKAKKGLKSAVYMSQISRLIQNNMSNWLDGWDL